MSSGKYTMYLTNKLPSFTRTENQYYNLSPHPKSKRYPYIRQIPGMLRVQHCKSSLISSYLLQKIYNPVYIKLKPRDPLVSGSITLYQTNVIDHNLRNSG